MPETTEIITTTNNLELPKPTTADDLLSMYEEEGESPAKEPEKSSSEVPVGKESKTLSESPNDDSVIEATAGDQKIAIPKDAKFNIEINGKTVEITQQDAIKAVQGQKEFERTIDKRMGDAGRKEQSVNNAFQNLLTVASKVSALTEAGDMLGANRELAKIASKGTQLDIVTWERKFFDQNEAFYKAYTTLTPDQKDRFFKDRKAQLDEEELKSFKNRDAQNAQRGELEAQVKTLQDENGIPNDEFWGTYKLIVDELTGEGKAFKAATDIKPEDVIEQTILNRRVGRIFEASNSLGLKDEAIIDEIIRTTAQYPEMTTEDFVQMIEKSGVLENAPQSSVENLNRRAQKSGLKLKSANSTKKETKTDGLDKEDLEFLYRRQPKVVKNINYR